jgi:hypothetical protein
MSRALSAHRPALVWLALGLVAGLVLSLAIGSGATAQADEHATGLERIALSKVEIDFQPGARSGKDSVWIYGSGFAPGTEVSLLLQDSNGVYQDVTSLATSFPMVANDDGAWATNWVVGRWTRKGVGGEGIFSLWVTDASFTNLSTHPIALCNLNNRAEGEETPDYCSQ